MSYDRKGTVEVIWANDISMGCLFFFFNDKESKKTGKNSQCRAKIVL